MNFRTWTQIKWRRTLILEVSINASPTHLYRFPPHRIIKLACTKHLSELFIRETPLGAVLRPKTTAGCSVCSFVASRDRKVPFN